MQDGGQFVAGKGLDHCMHVIGHHTPGEQVISLAVKMLQDACDDACDFVLFHPTGAVASIHVLIDLLREKVSESLVLLAGERPVHLPGGLNDVVAFRNPSLDDGYGK